MKNVAASLLIAVLSFVCGCTNSGQKKTERVNTDVIDAEKIQLQNRIDRKFDDPQAHYQLGKIYQREGLLERAVWEFTLALQFDPVHYSAQAAKVRV